MTNTWIALDLDGVLADYEGEYLRLTGKHCSEKGKAKAASLKPFPHFYRHLPLMPDAMKLWTFVKPYHPKILSAQSNFVPASAEDKREWVQEHFHLSGSDVVIVAYPTDKWKHVKPGAILVDDNAKNCQEWEHHGGIAVLHTSASNSIQELKKHLGHQEEGLLSFKAFRKVISEVKTKYFSKR